MRNHHKRGNGTFCFKKKKKDRLGTPEMKLANSPGSSGFSLEGCTPGRTHGREDGHFMYSLYRAHSTGEKGFHKRVTRQCKQYKKAGTLFCGNGQNRTLCLPQRCRIYTRGCLQGKCVPLGLVSLLSTECGSPGLWTHLSTASPATPGGAKL